MIISLKEYKRNEKHFDWSIFERKYGIVLIMELKDDIYSFNGNIENSSI